MSNNKYLEVLKTVINPHSNKSLGEENRVVEVTSKDSGEVKVIYNREGLSPEQKKSLEELMENALSTLVDKNNLLFMSRSNDSRDVFKSQKTSTTHSHTHASPSAAKNDQASLKVGHGGVGQKRKLEGVKKVIAVSSCKGGVGKSTVAANLAFSLKNLGKKVGLLDADIYGPSLPMLLNQKEAKPQATEDKKISPITAYGLPFISFGLFIAESEPVIWRGPMLGGVLNQFLFDVKWGELDYLIIDLPPGTGDMQLSLVQNCEVDGVVVVSTPQEVALLDSTKGLKMFQQVKVPVIGMIENMSGFICDKCEEVHDIFGKDGVKQAAKKLEIDFLGGIPLEKALRVSCDQGHPYMAQSNYEGKEIWKSYMNIAKKIDEKFLQTSGIKESIKSFFKM